jgi:hypothetical protein
MEKKTLMNYLRCIGHMLQLSSSRERFDPLFKVRANTGKFKRYLNDCLQLIFETKSAKYCQYSILKAILFGNLIEVTSAIMSLKYIVLFLTPVWGFSGIINPQLFTVRN